MPKLRLSCPVTLSLSIRDTDIVIVMGMHVSEYAYTRMSHLSLNLAQERWTEHGFVVVVKGGNIQIMANGYNGHRIIETVHGTKRHVQSKARITQVSETTSHRTKIRSPSSSTTARQSSRGSLLSTRRQTSATILSLDSISKQHCLRKESKACATCKRALAVTTWHPAMITGHVKL